MRERKKGRKKKERQERKGKKGKKRKEERGKRKEEGKKKKEERKEEERGKERREFFGVMRVARSQRFEVKETLSTLKTKCCFFFEPKQSNSMSLKMQETNVKNS